MDRNNDGFVTLDELDEFSRVIYKVKELTQDEQETYRWELKNLYPKDIIGSDNQFDFDEYWYLINTPITASGPGWTTPSPPTTKLTIRSKFYSQKPWQFWDANGNNGIDHDERFRIRMKQNRQGPLQSS